MARGGKREGAGRPKAAPTRNITFRVPIVWIPEIRELVKNRMTELRHVAQHKNSTKNN